MEKPHRRRKSQLELSLRKPGGSPGFHVQLSVDDERDLEEWAAETGTKRVHLLPSTSDTGENAILDALVPVDMEGEGAVDPDLRAVNKALLGKLGSPAFKGTSVDQSACAHAHI